MVGRMYYIFQGQQREWGVWRPASSSLVNCGHTLWTTFSNMNQEQCFLPWIPHPYQVPPTYISLPLSSTTLRCMLYFKIMEILHFSQSVFTLLHTYIPLCLEATHPPLFCLLKYDLFLKTSTIFAHLAYISSFSSHGTTTALWRTTLSPQDWVLVGCCLPLANGTICIPS